MNLYNDLHAKETQFKWCLEKKMFSISSMGFKADTIVQYQ